MRGFTVVLSTACTEVFCVRVALLSLCPLSPIKPCFCLSIAGDHLACLNSGHGRLYYRPSKWRTFHTWCRMYRLCRVLSVDILSCSGLDSDLKMSVCRVLLGVVSVTIFSVHFGSSLLSRMVGFQYGGHLPWRAAASATVAGGVIQVYID